MPESELIGVMDAISVWTDETVRRIDAEAKAVQEIVGSFTVADSRTLKVDTALSVEFDVEVVTPVVVADELGESEATNEGLLRALAVALTVGSMIDAVCCLLSL